MIRRRETDGPLMARLRDANPAPPGVLDERAEADLAVILARQTVLTLPVRRRPLMLAAAAAAIVIGVGTGITTLLLTEGDDVRGGRPDVLAEGPSASQSAIPSDAASSPPVMSSAPGARELLAALGPLPTYGYDPAEAPTDLASSADLVAVGDLVAIAPEGESLDCDGAGGLAPATPGVVLRLNRLEVSKGDPGMFTALIVVPSGGQGGLQVALPLGTQVLVYASPGASADCQDIYRVVSPQGLAVQASDGQVVWPLLGEVREGDLAQALPGGPLIAP